MRYCWILILSVLFLHCKESNLNKEVLNKQEMASLIVDLYSMDAYLDAIPTRSYDSIIKIERMKILDKHKISDSLFEKSMLYYNEHYKELEIVEGMARNVLLKRIESDSLKATEIDSTEVQ
ncbi:MAG: DUF4296 domain-containing protein [Saprospiraceae bacterium]|nr:DUF4296 domain-containing protein [Saprospiraceae bacterium]